MKNNLVRRIASLQFSAGRSVGRADNLGAKFFRLFVVIIVEFELDVHLVSRNDSRIGFPGHFVEKDVFAKIFRTNEAEFAIVADVLDLAQPFFLNPKWLLFDFVIVATWATLRGKAR